MMKIYSAISKRLDVLEKTCRGYGPMLICQCTAGIDEWEMRSGGSPYFGQVRTLDEWLRLADSYGSDIPVIIVSRPTSTHVNFASYPAKLTRINTTAACRRQKEG